MKLLINPILFILWIPTVILWVPFASLMKLMYIISGNKEENVWKFFGIITVAKPKNSSLYIHHGRK